MNKGLLVIILLMAGCTPVIVMESEDNCEIVTTRHDNIFTETWVCHGEFMTDDDMAMIAMNGVTK